MLLYIIFGLMAVWSFFPNLAYNIGPVPLFMLFFILLAIATLQNYRNVFSIPKWQLFIGLGLALLFSQLNAIRWEDTLKTTVATATIWGCIPFVGIWLRERKYRIFILYAIVLNLFLIDIYVIIYGGTLLELGTNGIFGPLRLSLNGTGMPIAMGSATILFIVFDKYQPTFVRVGTSAIILFSIYIVLFHLGSRSGLLGLFLSAGLTVYLTNRGRFRRMLFIGIITTTMLVGFTYIAYTQEWLPIHIHKRLFNLVNPAADSSLMLRVSFAKKTWAMFKDYPLTGGGWMNYRYYKYNQSATVYNPAGYQYEVSSDVHWPHSNYSRFLGETGLVGIIMYILILTWIIRILPWKIEKNNLIETGVWMWFPVYLFMSGFHDIIGYFPLLLFSLIYGKILESNWEPILMKLPNRNYYHKTNVALPKGQ